jgi:hypothetical protein
MQFLWMRCLACDVQTLVTENIEAAEKGVVWCRRCTAETDPFLGGRGREVVRGYVVVEVLKETTGRVGQHRGWGGSVGDVVEKGLLGDFWDESLFWNLILGVV